MKKKYFLQIILMFIGVVFLISCVMDPLPNVKISVYNSSDTTIYVAWYRSAKGSNNLQEKIQKWHFEKITSGNILYDDEWLHSYEFNHCDIHFFILEEPIFLNNDIENIADNNKWNLHKVIHNESELKAMDNTIVYTGDD